MSEPATETPTGHEAPAEGGGDPTLHQLAERVDRLTGMFERFMEGGGQQAEPEPPDIKAEVREAVREVQAKDKAKADRAAEQQSLADQVADLKAKVETPPFEYRPVTNRMGWAKP
jgi:hypothetical protein